MRTALAALAMVTILCGTVGHHSSPIVVVSLAIVLVGLAGLTLTVFGLRGRGLRLRISR